MLDFEALDIETVAKLFNVSSRQVRTYVQAGMPSRREGRTPIFNWYDCLDWYVAYKADIEYGAGPNLEGEADAADLAEPGPGKKEDIRGATLRKTRAEADLKETALSKVRGEIIVIADAKARLDRMMGNLRAKLLGMAPKLASRIEGLKTRTERESAIKEEMEQLCREVSTGAIVDLTDEPAAEVLEEVSASADTTVRGDGEAIGAGLLRAYDSLE